ncbi:hypothetical protein [Candidatus Regiella endosymbiont of Tuberolachnus salignus]|uniref:hypothetical protein n=1 Tax=Candidatus Regiella endosymbiont of Tuberolachnus salignus TaxID=3077956 RepID=UPI0030CCEA97
MNKIKTYLKILPILLSSIPVLAAQKETPVCKVWPGRLFPIKACTPQKLTVQKAKPSRPENSVPYESMPTPPFLAASMQLNREM